MAGSATTRTAASPPTIQSNNILDLPALLLQCIVALLDPTTTTCLRSTCKTWRGAVDRWASRCVIPLDSVRRHSQGPQELADRFPAATQLIIKHAHQRVSLSCCSSGHRTRQILHVFLDNCKGSWGALTSLDISDAVPYATCLTTDTLVDALPQLQHLALPACSTAAAESQCLAALARFSTLRSLAVDVLLTPTIGSPLQQLTSLTRLRLNCSPSATAPTHSPWGCLTSLRQLASLTVHRATQVAPLVAAAAQLPALTQMELPDARLTTHGIASELSGLRNLTGLTKLQLSPSTSPSSCSSSQQRLHHSSRCHQLLLQQQPTDLALPATAVAGLGQLLEADLAGWALDGLALDALASCSRLRRLKAGSLAVLAGCLPSLVLPHLEQLEVAHSWGLGSCWAAELMPRLDSLTIRQAAGSCPDLRPLKAHPRLRRLVLEVGDPEPLGQQLAWLVGCEGLTSLEVMGDDTRPLQMSCALPQLRRLVLRGSACDASLAALPLHHSSLQQLVLAGCYYVSDQGLRKVAAMPCLEQVQLLGCAHATEDGVRRLLGGQGLQQLVVLGCGTDATRLMRLAARCREKGGPQLLLVAPPQPSSGCQH